MAVNKMGSRWDEPETREEPICSPEWGGKILLKGGGRWSWKEVTEGRSVVKGEEINVRSDRKWDGTK